MYKTVLLKLSGEALGSETSPYDLEFIKKLAKQIKTIVDGGTRVGIVVGGGNIARGRELKIERVKADYIGMQATVMNAKMIEAALNMIGCKAETLSAVPAPKTLMFDEKKANTLLKKNTVVIFGGGLGRPFISTDTACATRAKQIGAEIILLAKNGTDGVYDKDPNKYKDAKKFNELTFNDIIDLKLKVIDLDAAKILVKNKIKAYVFDMAVKNNIVKAAKGTAKGTLIK